MICPSCRGEVPDTARVCGYCGTKLRVAAAVPAPEPPPPVQEALVREAPVPATPVREAPKAKPGRQGFDWRWLVLAVIVAASVAVALIQLDVFGGDEGWETTTTAASATSTSADLGLPAEVAQVLTDPRITYEADLSAPLAGWEYNPSLVSFGDNGAVFESDGTFARLQRARGAWAGRAVLIGLHWDSPIFNVMLEDGEWLEPGFRRWGVIVSDSIRLEVITDRDSLIEPMSTGDLAIEGKWWFLLGHDGDGYFAHVWREGLGRTVGYSTYLGTTWTSAALRFIVENPGGTVTLEDYWDLDFTSYIGG